jgi:3',5'-cyclic AMP phosphodiesterase CpdA
MSRRFGIPQLAIATQVQKDQHPELSQPFEPLPAPTGTAPYRLELSHVVGRLAPQQRVLHIIGDCGGVKDPKPQANVATAMIEDLEKSRPVAEVCYGVGDWVYFHGAEAEYPHQFQEPYAHYNLPMLGIPGNHDGDAEHGETSLEAYVRYFCARTPELRPEVAEYHRDTMTQPNCYWTLQDELVTIVGLYSNVPSGGEIQQDQVDWLASELSAAPKGVALIVALHHPPLSGDAHHGGSQQMGKVLDDAFAASGRVPDLVLSGHVHNWQRFSRTIGARTVPYVVCGSSGYHNLHGMASGAAPGLQVRPDTVLEAFDTARWGFLRLVVGRARIEGEYVAVAKDGTVTRDVDTFTAHVA